MIKNKKMIAIAVFILIIAILASCIFWFFNKNDSRYNDDLIIGKDLSTIVDTYGEFEHIRYKTDGSVGAGWYVLKKASFLGNKKPTYYIIVFEDDTAVGVYEHTGAYIDE